MQLRPRLRREVHRFPGGLELFYERKPPVRFAARGQRDDGRTPFGNVREKRRYALVAAFVDIKAAQLHKRPLAEKRHGVERIGNIVRRRGGRVNALGVKSVVLAADARGAKARNKVREKIILLAPEQIESAGSLVAQLLYQCAVIKRRFLFAERRLCHSVYSSPAATVTVPSVSVRSTAML